MITLTIPGVAVTDSYLFSVLSHDFSRQNLVTMHPVENGTDVTDHIVRQLDEYGFEAIISETPLGPGTRPGAQSWIFAADAFLQRAAVGTVDMQIAGWPVIRVAILGWAWRRDKAQRAIVSVRVREVRIAAALTVRIPPAAVSRTPAASGKQDLGNQNTVKADPSILAGLAGLGG